MDGHTVIFAVVCVLLWLSPVAVIVIAKRIGRHYEVDLRRQPPPDDIDYTKW